MTVENLPVDKRHTRTDLLAPFFEELLLRGLAECREQGLEIEVFESYRSPSRQDFLYEQGRTRHGKRVTNAKAWQSWHQYSLAVDLAFYTQRKWSWDGPWDKVHAVFEGLGFETLDFEKPHLQITVGMTTKEAYQIASKQGVLALWNLVELRFKAH